MSSTTPEEPTDPPIQPGIPPSDSDPSERPEEAPAEITLRDGESISFAAPVDGETRIVVNVVPPQSSTGFFGSCFQGCGCLVVVIVILAMIGSLVGR